MTAKETALDIKTLLLAIVGFTLIILYSFLLVHVLRGNKNKWVIANTIMMILSGFFFLPYAYGYLTFYLENKKNPFFGWNVAIGSGISDGFQAVVHFFLAMKY
jgi:uncharacterized oligopeptide transporter (OPT) family protein